MQSLFMEPTTQAIDNKNISTLFAYRYVLNNRNDIVDLRQDILDLRSFPERLFGSYRYEWDKYINKAMHEQGKEIDESALKQLIEKLSVNKQEELKDLLGILEETFVVVSSPNIIVIKSELETYIENLLKL